MKQSGPCWHHGPVKKRHTHRANSVSCGNINVSSFIDDYSQQERGHLFNDSLSHPNAPTRQKGGSEGNI